jgi:hypothetical protein
MAYIQGLPSNRLQQSQPEFAIAVLKLQKLMHEGNT